MSKVKTKYGRILNEGFFINYENERFNSVKSSIKVSVSIGDAPVNELDEITLTIPFADFVEVASREEFADAAPTNNPSRLNVWNEHKDMYVSVSALDFINEIEFDLKQDVLQAIVKEEVESAVYTNWLSTECLKNMYCADEVYSPIKLLLALEVWKGYLDSKVQEITGQPLNMAA